jgi:hypothetical protein
MFCIHITKTVVGHSHKNMVMGAEHTVSVQSSIVLFLTWLHIIVLQMVEEQAERVSHVSEGGNREPMTIPEIQTENSVSCVSVVSVTHVPYRVYRELPAGMSVCPCETKTSV